jgi:hypothetical protein
MQNEGRKKEKRKKKIKKSNWKENGNVNLIILN